MTDWNERVALITGAGRGIGAETARHLAASGVRVVVAARSGPDITGVAEDIRDRGGEATAVVCDVSKEADVKSAIGLAVEKYGALDILVNNAGVIDPIGELADTDSTRWSQAIDINLMGVYFGIHAALPHMLGRGCGTIINVSSGAATEVLEGWSAYCSAKAAVRALTGVVDSEYRHRGIRSIGLVPGTVATDMQTTIRASGINRVSKRGPDDHFPAHWPAQTIVWLCTAEADPYLGTDFSIKEPANRVLVGLR